MAVGGRLAGIPNRDKAELRALIQERVHEHTLKLRQMEIERLVKDGMSETEAGIAARQQVIEDYDPVVQMAMVAVDAEVKPDMQIRCASEVAQYVRPKLKSVELTADPEALETLHERQELSSRLVGLLEMAAQAKKTAPPPAPES